VSSNDVHSIECLWQATTPWRQASVLSELASRALGLLEANSPDRIFAVLTHDCDCVRNEHQEPLIELIAGHIVDVADPNLTHTKSLRRLHLPIHQQGTKAVIEFDINSRTFIKKVDLLPYSPDPNLSLSNEDRSILTRWITARYTRAALPDTLVTRLSPVKRALEEVGKNNPFGIIGIYMDYDPTYEIDSEDEPYELKLVVVYASREEGAAEAAHTAVEQIKERFERKYKIVETAHAGLQWKLIHLLLCEAIPDVLFSLRSALDYKLYNLDHISLRQSPIAPVGI
jgi:hypothetical protein